jgi:hypothetical protein
MFKIVPFSPTYKTHILRMLSCQKDGYLKRSFKKSTIDFYSQYCSYSSPNIRYVELTDKTISFYTVRYVLSDSVSSVSVFNLDSSLLNITPYEKQYLLKNKGLLK